MNRRLLLGGLLLGVCVVTLWGVWYQRSELAGLRAEQHQLLAQLVTGEQPASLPTPRQTGAAGPEAQQAALSATPELLRLRNEVTRLTERRRELEGVRVENERLRAELGSRATNALAGSQPPPGYIRKRDARMVGFNTPEDTLQTVLWAFQNHELTTVLQALSPEQAEQLRAHAGASREATQEFFRQTAAFVGMRVVKRGEDVGDGSIALEVEVVPGVSGPRIKFRQINGQWKIAEPL